MTTQSVNPATGAPFGPVLADTDRNQFDRALDSAASAPTISRPARAALLRGTADALDADAEQLVELADAETALGRAVLAGELARTTFQLRQVADQVEDGAYLQVHIDRADPSPLPAGHPDLRRVLVPVGPVAVFGASNFPFAFGVPGGDTATAIGAGCPVIVKAHPAHPQLSAAIGSLISAVARDAGIPGGVFALVSGLEVGRWLVLDDRIRAAAFTGSTAGGRALFDLAASRQRPIPFFGELGAVNPVFATRRGAADAGALARGWVDSLLVRSGQMCTNPGLLIVPRGSGVVEHSAALFATAPPAHLLTSGISTAYIEHSALVAGIPGAVTHRAAVSVQDGVTPALVSIAAADALASMDAVQTECFGPAGVVVEYESDDDAVAIAAALHGTLVAGVHGVPDEPLAARLVSVLTDVAGRVLWNGWPTGVAVSAAQQHGGPYPATTNPAHTSVGAAAINRFLRPVAFQDMPANLLPEELRDEIGAD